MKQKHLQLDTYVLHARPFRETSLLVEFFTRTQGRLSAVARGAYSGKSPARALLQPFNRILISAQGSTELLTLTQVERNALPSYLAGERLVCALYLNELLYHTLHRHDSHPALFDAYAIALQGLQNGSHLQITLREFELTLLDELGYGIDFSIIHDADAHYYYDSHHGFQKQTLVKDQVYFTGAQFSAIAQRDWECSQVLKAAKYLTRTALVPLLAGKIIHARELLNRTLL